MDTAAELGRNPVSKNQIQPEHGDEQADAERDCRTRLARPNSQASTRFSLSMEMSRLTRDGTAEPVSQDQIHFPCSADHVQDWQPYLVDPYSCSMCDHIYNIHTTYL